MKKQRIRATKSLWRCPRCGRQFTKAHQWHSCRIRSIDEHFRGKDKRLRSILDAMRSALERSGPLRIDAVESSINLVSVHHFGGVQVRSDYLRVGFILDHLIDHERIVHSQRIGPRRVAHHVQLHSVDDVDAELLAWLAAAQAMQARIK